jgi:hypothetical protein
MLLKQCIKFLERGPGNPFLQSAASGRNQKWADTITPPTKLLFPLPCIPSRVGEGKENGASNLLPSLDGRGWGRVILEHQDLSQKLGKNYIHHNTGGLTINKNNFFAGEKETQCYY